MATNIRLTGAQRSWLLAALQEWRAKGIVTAEQAERILGCYEGEEEVAHRTQKTMAFTLMSLASFLIGLAVLLVIGFNWEGLPREAKLAIVLIGVTAIHALGLYLRQRQRMPGLGEVVTFLGCLGYGAGIWLVAQAYHLNAHYPDGLWWWAVGVLPFALLLDSLLLHTLFAGLLAVWVGTELLGPWLSAPWWVSRWLPHALSLPLLVLPGLVDAYRKGSPLRLGLYVPVVAWWVFLQALASGSSLQAVFWGGSVAGLLLVLAEAHRPDNPMAVPYRVWGSLVAAGVLFTLSFYDFWQNVLPRHRSILTFDPGWPLGEWVLTAITALAPLGLLAGLFALSRRQTEAGDGLETLRDVARRQWFPGALVVGMSALTLCSLLLPHETYWWLLAVVLCNAALIGLAVYLIRIGAREERARPFVAGVLLFLTWSIVRYLDLFGEAGMLGGALLFTLCGAALFLLATYWPRLRAARQQRQARAPEATPLLGPTWLERLVVATATRGPVLLAATVGLQLAVLAGMIVIEALPLYIGQRVVLRTVPVDPRDFFRGDYVILNYDVNRTPLEGIAGEVAAGRAWQPNLEGRTVFVPLEAEEDGIHFRGGPPSLDRPTRQPYLRGRVVRGRLEFGIEAYYVQEGSGRHWERIRNDRKLSAEVAVAPRGKAKLVRLIMEE